MRAAREGVLGGGTQGRRGRHLPHLPALQRRHWPGPLQVRPPPGDRRAHRAPHRALHQGPRQPYHPGHRLRRPLVVAVQPEPARDAHDDHITTLYNAFKNFYEEDETIDMVLDQWHVMTVDISSKPGLMSLKFKELWARVLMHKHDECAASTSTHYLHVHRCLGLLAFSAVGVDRAAVWRCAGTRLFCDLLSSCCSSRRIRASASGSSR
mmetsp:Transcript_9627/g.30524  ORF Transcript_9627/g.30524 Transcript_9627/m.30524 type:complete len:209 (-) Transcript_9627:323-949(-)